MTILLLLALAATAQAETKVREAIGTLEKALTAKDDSVGDQFEFQRLLKEMERRGAIPDGTSDGFHSRGVRRLEENFSSIISAPGALNGGWERVEPLTVRLNPAGDEAQAMCRVSIGGKKGKFRFWLRRVGDAWRPFDYENLDGSYRLSVIGLQYAPGIFDDEEKNSLRDGVMTLQRAQVYLSKGQVAGAREALAMAKNCTPPTYVMDYIELVDGLALRASGNASGALKAADRVLAHTKDLAVAQRLKAACLLSLGEPAKAMLAAKEYLELVGPDAEAWVLIGGAHEKLKESEQALDAYRKSAEIDSEDWDSRWHLSRALRRLRRFDEALATIRTAIEKSGEKARFQDELGRTFAEQGKVEEALAVAEDVIKSRPEAEAAGRDLRIAVLAIGGKRDAALQELETLLGGHPEWHAAVLKGEELEEFRKLPAVQELLGKARAKGRK
ncbi:MAG TPA: tetratricopeptide repeat protein [Planctomycetota bacterium]|nr:tetratricopeptide repeat protein [Planctomycetota bacterium]